MCHFLEKVSYFGQWSIIYLKPGVKKSVTSSCFYILSYCGVIRNLTWWIYIIDIHIYIICKTDNQKLCLYVLLPQHGFRNGHQYRKNIDHNEYDNGTFDNTDDGYKTIIISRAKITTNNVNDNNWYTIF